jgi:hypothetical protein
MTPETLIFNLRVSTIPLLNARGEFNRNCRILSAPEFRAQMTKWRYGCPIHAQYIIWGGEPSALLTWFLQRTIIGLEAYIPPIAFMAAIHYGRLSPAVIEGTKDPFSLRGGSAVKTFYNCLPGLVDSGFRLERAHEPVWKRMQTFYKDVRNPLFHGSQLVTNGHDHGETLDSVLRAFDLFIDIYNWADWWFPPKLFAATGTVSISEPPRLEDFLKRQRPATRKRPKSRRENIKQSCNQPAAEIVNVDCDVTPAHLGRVRSLGDVDIYLTRRFGRASGPAPVSKQTRL